MKKTKYQTPELQELGKAEKLTLSIGGPSTDACSCSRKKGKAA
jgi:hypothetical protein